MIKFKDYGWLYHFSIDYNLLKFRSDHEIPFLRADDIVYPSIGTAINKKTHVARDSDLEEICLEVNQASPESILNNHIVTRLQNDHSSALTLKRIIAIKIFITKFEYAGMTVDDENDE